MSKVKVGHLVAAFNAGGIERLIAFTTEPLLDLGIETSILALNDVIVVPKEFERLNVPISALCSDWKPIRFPILPPKWLIEKLRAFQAEQKIDVLHAHHYAAIGAAPMVAKQLGVPYVVTHHATNEAWQTQRSARMSLLRRYMAQSFSGAKSIVCWSRFIADDVDRVCGRKLNTYELIDVPIDDRFFGAADPGAVRDFDVVMLGRLAPQKNPIFAVEVLAELRGRLPGLKVAILGAGPSEDEVRAKVEELKLTDSVAFFGNVGPDVVLSALNRSKVHYMPSLFEGLSQAIIESLTMGLDAVVSDIPNFRAPFDGLEGIQFVSPLDRAQNVEALERAIEGYRFVDRPQFAGFNRKTYAEKMAWIYENAVRSQ